MTFEEYEEKHLHDLNHEARRLVRMGWNARGRRSVPDLCNPSDLAGTARSSLPG